jgi:hypothetical protein
MDDAAARLGTNNQYTSIYFVIGDNEKVMQLNFVVRKGTLRLHSPLSTLPPWGRVPIIGNTIAIT